MLSTAYVSLAQEIKNTTPDINTTTNSNTIANKHNLQSKEYYYSLALELSFLYLPLHTPLTKHFIGVHKLNATTLPIIKENSMKERHISIVKGDTYKNTNYTFTYYKCDNNSVEIFKQEKHEKIEKSHAVNMVTKQIQKHSSKKIYRCISPETFKQGKLKARSVTPDISVSKYMINKKNSNTNIINITNITNINNISYTKKETSVVKTKSRNSTKNIRELSSKENLNRAHQKSSFKSFNKSTPRQPAEITYNKISQKEEKISKLIKNINSVPVNYYKKKETYKTNRSKKSHSFHSQNFNSDSPSKKDTDKGKDKDKMKDKDKDILNISNQKYINSKSQIISFPTYSNNKVNTPTTTSAIINVKEAKRVIITTPKTLNNTDSTESLFYSKFLSKNSNNSNNNNNNNNNNSTNKSNRINDTFETFNSLNAISSTDSLKIISKNPSTTKMLSISGTSEQLNLPLQNHTKTVTTSRNVTSLFFKPDSHNNKIKRENEISLEKIKQETIATKKKSDSALR